MGISKTGHALRVGLLATTALTAAALAATPAGASTWTGAVGDWFDPSNWSSGVPASGDAAIVGTGTAQVQDGDDAVSASGLIGNPSGNTGTVEVGGVGSTWTLGGGLNIGNLGTGLLDIAGGGAVTSSGTASLGWYASGTGDIAIDGTGSAWTHDGEFYVGVSGAGSLDIANGGAANTGVAVIGNSATGTGAVTVDGAGSTWVASGNITVGKAGEGTLDITNGGAVGSAGGYIGAEADSTGTVTVDGADSTWTNSAELVVGSEGEGTLDITDGGTVSNVGARLGDDGGSGFVMVDGEGSTWTNSGTLIVGNRGEGTLDVSNGGAVSNVNGRLGNDGGSGFVTVDGVGSTWTSSGNLYVGDASEGTLSISNGGYVGAQEVHIASEIGSTGTLNFGAAEGETAVAAGTLDTSDIFFGDGTGSIVFNHTSTDFVLDADISGTGTLSQFGSGRTRLTGDSSAFDGDTFIEAGSFFVDGQLGGDIYVVDAILGGTGTVGTTNLGGGAVIAPGSATATLTVDGNLVFSDYSTYQVETDPDGATNGLIHVTGTATLGGASVAHVGVDGPYTDRSNWTILTADGGLSGVFGPVTSTLAFLTPDLTYDLNNVYLELARNDIGFDEVGATPNQQGVAAAAEALGAGNPIFDEIMGMTEEEARAAYDALSGEAHGSAGTASFQSAQQIGAALLARLQMLSGGGSQTAMLGFAPAAGDALLGDAPAIWGQIFGSWGTNDGDANVAKLDRRSAGFLVGIDKAVGEASRVGVAAGYSRSSFDVSARASSGDSDNFHVATYAGTKLGIVDLGGTLSYSYGKSETTRTVIVGGLTDTLTADYDAHTFQAYAEAGIDFDMGPVVLTPFAGLSATHVETDGFTEQGGPSALTISSADNTTGVTTLGLRARRQAGQVALTGSLAWRHAFGDVDPSSRAAFASAPATTYAVRGTAISENALALETGIDLKLDTGTTLSFGYAGEYASDARDHGLKAELRFEF